MIETQWRYAGFWIRFVAYIVDSIVLTILFGILLIPVAMAVGFWGALTEGVWNDNSGRWDDEIAPYVVLGWILITAVTFIISWLYFALFECSSRQATPGKMMVGIRVVDARGQRLTFARATGRTLGKVLSGILCNIGYIIAAFTERKQALHDMLAGSYVVEEWAGPLPGYHAGPQVFPPRPE